MKEVDGLILFGYGGGDAHLNNLIEQYFQSKTVEIVERSRSEYQTDVGKRQRFDFWKNALDVNKVVAFWLDDILTHRQWSYNHVWK